MRPASRNGNFFFQPSSMPVILPIADGLMDVWVNGTPQLLIGRKKTVHVTLMGSP
jgi:hypothetical protein